MARAVSGVKETSRLSADSPREPRMDVPCTQLQAGAARAVDQGRTGGSDMNGDSVRAALFFVGMTVLLIWLVVSFIRSTK